MSLQPPQMSIPRLITMPHSKLQRLCAEAANRGGRLTRQARVAEALGVTRGRVSHSFGSRTNRVGVVIDAATVGRIAALFTADGVPCEIAWFYLDLEEFEKRVAAAPPTRPPGSRLLHGPGESPAADWELHEGTVLADLVELRLHPPRPGNEVPNSYLVDATLLFGIAVVDYLPEEGEAPRSIAIGLKNARLAIPSTSSYQPLRGTMLGEMGRKSEHFERVAGGIELTGPKGADGTLKGDPLGEQHLAIIAATQASDTPFAVNVAAPSGSFIVTDRDLPPAVRDRNEPDAGVVNRNAILNHFIYRLCAKDELNRAVLARAELKRRAEDCDLS
jgi:hypothetical protein